MVEEKKRKIRWERGREEIRKIEGKKGKKDRSERKKIQAKGKIKVGKIEGKEI